MNELSFEEAYSRLEKILETLNTGSTSLEEALHLYEEANKLMSLCQNRLQTAEQKIQKMIKVRDESFTLEPFHPQTEAFLK